MAVAERCELNMPTSQYSRHPIIKPPEEYEVPKAPVRDDDALGISEDLDREPDGVPHRVIGFTALFSVMLALLVGFMMLAGGTVSRVAAIVIVVMAIPVLVSTLRTKATRDRDYLHPSR
ncbi:MAG: hypothetical protein HOV81_11250 [Kofleriaceae bacterium]|nr:hypothetical protein [Kofleriaceae bacterium]